MESIKDTVGILSEVLGMSESESGGGDFCDNGPLGIMSLKVGYSVHNSSLWDACLCNMPTSTQFYLDSCHLF